MSSPVPQRKNLARASLTLGILGLLGFGPITGLPAVVCGRIALRRARTDPAIHGGKRQAVAGMILGYVGLVVGLSVAVLIATSLLSRFSSGGAGSAAANQRCIAHLRQLAIALRVHADDHQGAYPTELGVLTHGLIAPEKLRCPDARPGAPITYEILATERKKGPSAGNPLVARCPIHGISVHADATLDNPARP